MCLGGCLGLLVLLSADQQLQHAGHVDLALVVDVELVEGLVHLLGGELLAPGHQRVPERVAVDGAVALVERLESLDDDVVVVGLAGLSAGEHGEQHGEVDGARRVRQHLLDLLLRGDAADDVEGAADVRVVQDAVLVGVHQLEALLELIDLLLGEAGEDAAALLLAGALRLSGREGEERY